MSEKEKLKELYEQIKKAREESKPLGIEVITEVLKENNRVIQNLLDYIAELEKDNKEK